MFRWSRWFYVVAVLYCCTFKVTTAQFDAAEVVKVIEQTMNCYNNKPGLMVSVVKEGKTIFSRGFGVRNIETKEPVTPDTRFGIASVSKSFAATLLVKLLYEKTKRLPLLPTNDQFRVKHIYSNLIYGLITYIAEVIGEDTWENLLTSHLLRPLGMDSTTFATTADLKTLPNLATGYNEFRDEIYPVHTEFSRKWGLLAGSGAVMSTANDMAKWMNFHLSKGRDGNGKRVMDEAHVDEVHKARILTSNTRSVELRKPEFPIMATQNVYAHGFRKGYYRGHERLVHSGSTLGYKALMNLFPEQQIAVFTALTGTDSNYVYRTPLHYFLADLAMGVSDPWLNASTICSFPEPWRRASKSSPVKLDASRRPALNYSLFEGTYHNKAYGFLHVRYNESLETLQLNYGWGSWQMFYTPSSSSEDSTHRFYGKGIDITDLYVYPMYFIQQSKDNEDVIVGLRATAFESALPPVFEKLGVQTNGTKSAQDSAKDSATRCCINTHIILLVVLIGAHLESIV
ncbi:hypothetical protein EGW08_010934 [Elysia chlorotica]|uniref:Beta-lactamase-related domain-containing protein n=1 Tax=Elysia chlorotica TaxID=188477 RepID=A0A3S1HKD9_ELYCH|nr:hypothetical protein EGW08_010934 [Elysia chlorotica]